MSGHDRQARVPLPPKALLLSLAAQALVYVGVWPAWPGMGMVLPGAALLMAGTVLNIWAERLFRRNDVGVCPFTPVGALVWRGPYRISRNPMYLGILCISGGAALASGLSANLWATAALALYLHFRFVLPEEEFLHARLGVPYLQYALRTPRWLGLPAPRPVR